MAVRFGPRLCRRIRTQPQWDSCSTTGRQCLWWQYKLFLRILIMHQYQYLIILIVILFRGFFLWTTTVYVLSIESVYSPFSQSGHISFHDVTVFLGQIWLVRRNSPLKVINYFKLLWFGSSQHLTNGSELWQKLHCSIHSERVEELKYHRYTFIGAAVLELRCKEGWNNNTFVKRT